MSASTIHSCETTCLVAIGISRPSPFLEYLDARLHHAFPRHIPSRWAILNSGLLRRNNAGEAHGRHVGGALFAFVEKDIVDEATTDTTEDGCDDRDLDRFC